MPGEPGFFYLSKIDTKLIRNRYKSDPSVNFRTGFFFVIIQANKTIGERTCQP